MKIATAMAQGRSTEIISMIKWIRTSGLSTKNPLSHVVDESDPDHLVVKTEPPLSRQRWAQPRGKAPFVDRIAREREREGERERERERD